MKQVINRMRPWSLIAPNVSEGQEQAYRETFHFPLHIEAAVSTVSRRSSPSADTHDESPAAGLVAGLSCVRA